MTPTTQDVFDEPCAQLGIVAFTGREIASAADIASHPLRPALMAALGMTK